MLSYYFHKLIIYIINYNTMPSLIAITQLDEIYHYLLFWHITIFDMHVAFRFLHFFNPDSYNRKQHFPLVYLSSTTKLHLNSYHASYSRKSTIFGEYYWEFHMKGFKIKNIIYYIFIYMTKISYPCAEWLRKIWNGCFSIWNISSILWKYCKIIQKSVRFIN